MSTHVLYLRPTADSALAPGTGSNDAHTPTVIGSGTGSDENAIARWDVVPYQKYASDFQIGVVAWHINGINYVEFQADGGTKVQVSTTSTNTVTGTVGYNCTLTTKATDGVVNVRARIVPNTGTTRAVDLVLYSNGNGTAHANTAYISPTGNDTTGDGSSGNPYLTIKKAALAILTANADSTADGGLIYCKAGSYVVGYTGPVTTTNYWLTVTHAPGVARTDVIITGSETTDGLRTKLVRFYDVKVTGGLNNNSGTNGSVWLDNCRFVGAGSTVAGSWLGGWLANYWTDCEVSDCRDGPSPNADLVRSCNVHDIGSDAYSDAKCVINCAASNIDAGASGFHPDVYQFFATTSNIVLYGITATSGLVSQGIFAGDNVSLQDVAIINCTIDNTASGVGRGFSFGGATRHLFVKNHDSTSPNNTWAVAPDAHFVATNVVVESSTFDVALPAASGVTVR